MSSRTGSAPVASSNLSKATLPPDASVSSLRLASSAATSVFNLRSILFSAYQSSPRSGTQSRSTAAYHRNALGGRSDRLGSGWSLFALYENLALALFDPPAGERAQRGRCRRFASLQAEVCMVPRTTNRCAD